MTILVFVATGVMIRLGIWQLDRLEQRREFNARVREQSGQTLLQITAANQKTISPEMEYRQVSLQGEYDFTHEIVLRNQVWHDQSGVHLLTPLHISGSDQYVYINRGWIPLEAYNTGNLDQFHESGVITVTGIIRASQAGGFLGINTDPTPVPGENLNIWNMVNIENLALQTPYSLLPVYIQQLPDPSWQSLPYRSEVKLELSEGPHQGYALQWFTFALILGIGYPIFVRREEMKSTLHVAESKIDPNKVGSTASSTDL